MDIIAKRKLFAKSKDSFYRMFGVPLKDFWDIQTMEGLMCGFNITKFDEEVVTPNSYESTRNALQRQFGTDAVNLIVRLLHM